VSFKKIPRLIYRLHISACQYLLSEKGWVFSLTGSPDEIILECYRFWVGRETTNKWLWFYTESHLLAGISCTSGVIS